MSEDDRNDLLLELAYLHDVLEQAQVRQDRIPQRPSQPRGRSHSDRGGRGGRGRGGRGRYPRGTHHSAAPLPQPAPHGHAFDQGSNEARQFSWRRTQSSNAVLTQNSSTSNPVGTIPPTVNTSVAQSSQPSGSRRVVKPPSKKEPVKKREVAIRTPAASEVKPPNSGHSKKTPQSISKRKVILKKPASKTPVGNKYTWHNAAAAKGASVTPHRLSSSFSSPLMASTPNYNSKNFSSPKLNIRLQRIVKSKPKIVNRVASQHSSKYKLERNASQIQKPSPMVYKLKSRYRLVKKAVYTQHMITARRSSGYSARRQRSSQNWPSTSLLSPKQLKRPAFKSKFKVDRRKAFVPHSVNRRMVLLRGTKFAIQRSGLSLRRISTSTSAHSRSRSLAFERANLALNKSIKTAVHKAKKRSLKYCIYFNRFGRCYRGNNCPNTHDPKRVAVCTRFLRGTCKISDCPFSHDVAPEKMPTCQHFLRGACSRDNCPYLHVKVSENAEICPAFANGFCPLADKCKKKHILQTKKRHSFRAAALPPVKRVKRQEKRKTSVEPPHKVPPDETDDLHLPMKDRTLPSFIALGCDSSSDISTELQTGRRKKDEIQLIRPRLPFNI